LVRAKDLSLDTVNGLPKNTQLQRRARKHLNYELSLDLNDFSLYSQFNYVGKRPDVDYSVWPPEPVELDSYTQINLGANYYFSPNWTFKLKVNDVTNEAPISVLTYNSAGRQIFFTVQYHNF